MNPNDIASVSSPIFTSRACIIWSVSGSLITKVDPLPSSLYKSTVPPSAAILVLTTSIPTPLPEISVTTSLVLNPCAKIKFLNTLRRNSNGIRMLSLLWV